MRDPLDYLDEDYGAYLDSKVHTKEATHARTKKVGKPAAPVTKPGNADNQRVEEVETKVDPNSLAPDKGDKASPSHKKVAEIEVRFLEVAGLTGDLTHFPIDKSNHLQVKTDKSKSDKHGEVFTPLWLVDQMIERVSNAELKDQGKTTMDLCSGYGQFSLRLMRRKLKLLGDKFDLDRFLGETHAFVELQAGSCFKLLYIFGTGIRLCMGDATKMGQLPDDAETGIWVWCQADSKWKDMTAKIIKKFNKIMEGGYGPDKAERFEDWFDGLQARKSGGGRGEAQ